MPQYIIELVEEGVLAPIGREQRAWRFTGSQVRRASIALRLQRDLGVNLAGVALALDLLDELNGLRARITPAATRITNSRLHCPMTVVLLLLRRAR